MIKVVGGNCDIVTDNFLSDDEIGDLLEKGLKACDEIESQEIQEFSDKYLSERESLKQYLKEETYFFNQACEKVLGINPYGFLIPIDKYLNQDGNAELNLDKIELEIKKSIKFEIEKNKKNIEKLEGLLEIFHKENEDA